MNASTLAKPRAVFAVAVLFFALIPYSVAADAAALWSGNVQPLFDVQCVKCHGLIERKSGLELDSPEAVLKGGDDGKVVVPGNPEKSRLYKYLASTSDPHMPPKKQLTDAERESVRQWIIALGAKPEKSAPKPAAASSLSDLRTRIKSDALRFVYGAF